MATDCSPPLRVSSFPRASHQSGRRWRTALLTGALIGLATFPLTHSAATLGWNADALSAALAAAGKLPPAPAGVTDLAFTELFKTPVGPAGIEFSDRALALKGQTVRILGFMVHQEQPTPGLLLLAPFALSTDEAEYGLCDDLPASVLFVSVPSAGTDPVPFTPGPLVLTGRLDLGFRAEADGRLSHLRLAVESQPVAPSATLVP